MRGQYSRTYFSRNHTWRGARLSRLNNPSRPDGGRSRHLGGHGRELAEPDPVSSRHPESLSQARRGVTRGWVARAGRNRFPGDPNEFANSIRWYSRSSQERRGRPKVWAILGRLMGIS
jgi:hypothetical protein